jgi:probable HAF family extracellular repeat protein
LWLCGGVTCTDAWGIGLPCETFVMIAGNFFTGPGHLALNLQGKAIRGGNMKSRTLMFRSALAVALFAFTQLTFAQLSLNHVSSMQLLTRNVGWASTDSELFWTVDLGMHWKNISPPMAVPESIASVFFLNESMGWVLLSAWDPNSDSPRFDVASTTDAGSSWSITQINMAPQNFGELLGPGGRIDFVDSVHGWVNLDAAGSSNFRPGVLLATQDGGKTWHGVSSRTYPGFAGAIRFVTTKDGWLAGGPGNEYLYVTHDGGRSWQQTIPNPPPQVNPAVYPVYDLPTFLDERNGFLPVTYSGKGLDSCTLEVFLTHDGGGTWTPDSTIFMAGPAFTGVPTPSAIAGSRLITANAMSSNDAPPAISSVPIGIKASSNLGAVRSAVSEISFQDPEIGWILVGNRLLATSDAGNSWVELTPVEAGLGRSEIPLIKTEPLREGLPSVDQASSGLLAFPTQVSAHLGFDECQATTDSNMQTWWTYSPYFDTGIYIGGKSRSCPQPNLTSNWVNKVTTQGWGLLPLWAGPQAPCACKPKTGTYPNCTLFPNTFSADPTTANSDGIAEANSAESYASTLGLAGSIVYYDMENYNSTICGAAVNAFLSGWDNQLSTDGFASAGVYGSPADAKSWKTGGTGYVAVSPAPDDIWVAKQDKRATIWGLGYGLADSMWGKNQRVHQYGAPHNETWSGLTLSIDTDIEDAEVVAGNAVKQYTFTFQEFDCFSDTRAHAINNVGQVVGYYTDNLGNDHGYLYSKGLCITIDPQGSTASRALGINNAGNVVGYWEDTFGNRRGYEYSSKKNTFITTTINCGGTSLTTAAGINDDGQIVGHYTDSNSQKHGFVYKGKCHVFDYPGASDYTIATAINGSAQVVGYYGDSNGNSHGFLYYPLPPNWVGNFDSRLIDCPDLGSISTDPQGINNQGQVVGYWHSTDGTVQGFFYNGGLCTLISQSSGETEAYGIRDDTTIVGAYPDASGAFHGFTGEVPH